MSFNPPQYNSEPIQVDPLPTLKELGHHQWLRELIIKVIDPIDSSIQFDWLSERVTCEVIILVKELFQRQFPWILELNIDEVQVRIQRINENTVNAQLYTGRYTKFDPLWIGALYGMIFQIEQHLGTIISFEIEGREYPDWNYWQLRKLTLGNKIEN